MKILFAIKGMDHAKGGAERVLADVASAFASNGYDVLLLTFDAPGGKSFYPLDKKIRRISLGIGDVDGRATIRETCSRMKSLRHVVAMERPDVVIAFMHSMFIPLSFSLVGAGVPVIASEHIVPEHYKTRRFEFFLFCICFFFVSRITVLSERIKRSYPAFLQKKMQVINNPVRKADIFLAPSPEIGKGQKIILNVGRLNHQKDQETLIKAFAKLAPQYPDWGVRIVGEGELKQSLTELVITLNLQGRVYLTGATDNINTEYRSAHIFAMPSIYESFGLATAEAMAFGLPAVGFSDCPGTNELIVDGENGILVNASDRVDGFSKGLKQLMDSPQLRSRLGSKAIHHVSQYQLGKVITAWENLVDEVVNK